MAVRVAFCCVVCSWARFSSSPTFTSLPSSHHPLLPAPYLILLVFNTPVIIPITIPPYPFPHGRKNRQAEMTDPSPVPPRARTVSPSRRAACTPVHQPTDLEGLAPGSPKITGHSPISNTSTSLSEVDEDLIAGHESLAPQTPQAPKAALAGMADLAIQPRAQSDPPISRMTERERHDTLLAVEIQVESAGDQTRACTSPPADEKWTRSRRPTPKGWHDYNSNPPSLEGLQHPMAPPQIWDVFDHNPPSPQGLRQSNQVGTPSLSPTGAKFNMYNGPRLGYSLSAASGSAEIVNGPVENHIEPGIIVRDFAVTMNDHRMQDQVEPVATASKSAEVMEDHPREDQIEPVTTASGLAEVMEDHPMEDYIESPTPVAAPAAAQPRQPVTPTSASRRSSMIIGRPVMTYVRGPRKEFPAYLRPALEEWHENQLNETPEWALRLSMSQASQWEPFQIFGREGEEHDLSVYSVSVKTKEKGRKMKYALMLLHTEGAEDEFVGTSTCRPAKGKGPLQGMNGTYLIVWNRQRKCWENQIAAIRVWFPKGHKGKGPIAFRPGMFDKAVGNIRPTRRSKGNEDFEEDSGSDEKSPPKPPKKKAKLRIDSNGSPTLLSAPMSVSRALFYSPNVRIKLASEKAVRYFPLDGCSIETLFSKARQFYGDEKMSSSEEAGLACKLAGMKEARFIGENCADEWDILCRDIRDLTLKEEGIHLVEVQPADVGKSDEMKVVE